MPKAPKIDPKKYAAHMARNKKPKNMSSTQKSLSDISKRANEAYNEPQGQAKRMMSPLQKMRMDKEKRDRDRDGKLKPGVVKGRTGTAALRRRSLNQSVDENYKKEYQHHSQGLKDAEADMKAAKTRDAMVKAMNKKAHHKKALSKMNRMESVSELYLKKNFGSSVDPKKFDMYKRFVRANNVDEPTVRMIIDNPRSAESQRMLKNKDIAKAVELRKAATRESVEEGMSALVKAGNAKAKGEAQARQMAAAAKELETYARKNGGIDKTDFMKAAVMMKRHQKSKLDKFVDDLDTEPREKILSVMKKHLKEEYIDEKLKVSDGMGAWIEDFVKSDAPQFQGKSKEERRDMAIAAYLSAKKKDK